MFPDAGENLPKTIRIVSCRCKFAKVGSPITGHDEPKHGEHLILSLSWADGSATTAPRMPGGFSSPRRVSRSLVLHLGVELSPYQDDDDGKPDPDHEADTGP